MLVTLYKIGDVQFRMFATNSFHVKAENERFAAAGSRCRQNLKYENFTSFLEVPMKFNREIKERPREQLQHHKSMI